MLDKFKIKSYAWSNDVYFAGLDDYNNKCVEITGVDRSDAKEITILRANVRQNNTVYSCGAVIGGASETVLGAQCTCPNRCDAFGYCRHVVAALLTFSEMRGNSAISAKKYSSPAVKQLISGYSDLARSDAELMCSSERVEIEPQLSVGYNSINLSFRIGRGKRKYIIKNLPQLLEDFFYHRKHSYGKELEFVHDSAVLDDRSRQLLDFISMYLNSSGRSSYGYFSSDKKCIPLTGAWTEKFLTSSINTGVLFDGIPHKVSSEDPNIKLSLKKHRKKDVYYLKLEGEYVILSSAGRCCMLDPEAKHFYICSEEFTRSAVILIDALIKSSGGSIDIAESDMSVFYSSVIEPVKKYLDISVSCDIAEYLPPEAEIRLYLDSPAPDEVCGRLEYTYGTENYTAFVTYDSQKTYRDLRRETAAEHMVSKYFDVNAEDAHHPLMLTDPDRIYSLFSEGIPELSKIMELYASERFNRMNIRPPVYPSVGVRPESNLLAIDIDSDGYDMEDLLGMLSSYRKGMKYHRLRDGSFVDLTQGGIGEFAELADGLNLSDKAMLKEQITVPRYRMLYLDSLRKEEGSIRIKRSAEFKKAVRAFSDIASSDYQPPEELEDTMREYQIYGYRWMRTIAAYGFGGILADDMGLGKTLQAIALMLSFKQENESNGGGHRINLVVCPSSLTLNWENEINKFAPDLKAAVIIGTAAHRTELIEKAAEADVIITSYSLLTRDIPDYTEMNFYCQFIDEAQFIKNHNTQAAKAVKAINSEIRFALTGTPVENSLAELWSIYDYVMPEYLFNYNHFKKTYETPIVKNSDEKSVKALKKMTSPFILRRLKKDVLTELPDKTEISMSADMTAEQKKLYAANVISMKKTLSEKAASAMNNEGRFEILAMLTRLRQICCDPSLVYDNYKGGSGKLEQCMELIDSCINSGHKMLLFSQFTSMLDIIAARLDEAGVKYYMLTGSTKAEERLRMVNAFNSDDIPVFMISLKAGGTGLNLTGADIVIHYDPWWNVSAENQATDRAYRIGQRNNVSVYKLITKGTIEEKILELQKSKAELADMAVNGEGDIMHMSPADIMAIIDN